MGSMAKPIPGHIGYYIVEPFDPTDRRTLVRVLLDMSWWSRYLYKRRRLVSIGERQPKGFTAPEEFFLYECPNCGPVLTYPHGHYGRIECTPCVLEGLHPQPDSSAQGPIVAHGAEEESPTPDTAQNATAGTEYRGYEA
ncbi:hypothetical protein A3A38_02185 [Candidatus Kaiserbacteria bacterium RIFCSPLOWO2_01_FULL_53_17]|uniref:Uncharacterized protein n=1 Tax=Candidatus Kaiserbacteria bacterium RIFCSPLOWO2_01_FULL_53_17 TaxID=1798511 RepID=A0A1F6EFQ5_9BACT|nr:MAG: hypothetical protein A3A38_02185 [Candidatus Kaiserbacteria bacterium RIFCSPLOWO2_01_FULL_53_17]